MTHHIQVEFKKHRDWYIASAKNLRGLFVAAPSKEEMFADVPEAIKTLFKFNMGLDVRVYEAQTPEPQPMDEITYIAQAA